MARCRRASQKSISGSADALETLRLLVETRRYGFGPCAPSGQYGRSEHSKSPRKLVLYFGYGRVLVSVGGGHAAIWSGAFYQSSRRFKGQFAMKTSFVFPWRAPPMDLPLQILLTALLLQSGACPRCIIRWHSELGMESTVHWTVSPPVPYVRVVTSLDLDSRSSSIQAILAPERSHRMLHPIHGIGFRGR
jgi:hypothetical protein